MKRFLTLVLTALAVFPTLSGCGCDDGRDIGLVFVNGSNTAIASVQVEFEDRGGAVQHADSSPLKRGESFGFEAGEYPATVVVYDSPLMGEELARLTITEAPAGGARWYVTARDGADGLALTAGVQWPEGV